MRLFFITGVQTPGETADRIAALIPGCRCEEGREKPMELKRLSLADRERISALFCDVFTHAPWHDDWSDPEQLNAYIDDLVGQRCSLALGYFDGEKLAGLAMGYIKHWYAGTEYVIDEYCIDRRLQGRGIGSAFLRAIEAYLTGQGIRRMFLQTEQDAPAYAFYRRRGFQELTGHVSFSKEIKP